VEHVEAAVEEMRLLVEKKDGVFSALTHDVADHARMREKRYTALRTWANNIWDRAATFLEKASVSLVHMVYSTNDRAQIGHDKVADDMDRMEKKTEEPNSILNQLIKVHYASQSLKRMRNDSYIMSDYIQTWTNATWGWRREITKAFSQLAENLRDADTELADAGRKFTKTLKAQGVHSRQAQEQRMTQMYAGEMDEDAKAEAAGQHAMDGLTAQLNADAQSDVAAWHYVEAASGSLASDEEARQKQERLDKQLLDNRRTSQKAFDSAYGVLSSQQAEYDEARGKLHGKLREIGTALGDPTVMDGISLLDVNVKDLDKSDLEDLKTNVALSAEHRHLAEEVRALSAMAV
jgi:hypothetical protein